MFVRIAVKSFWKSRKDFFVLFSSTALAVAMIMSFLFFIEISIYLKQVFRFGNMETTMETFLPVIIAASIFLIVYMMKFYVKARMGDYGILIIHGIRKRMLACFVAVECVVGVLLAMACGFGLGTLIVLLLITLLGNAGIHVQFTVSVIENIYKSTANWCVLLVIGIALVLIVLLNERDLSQLLTIKVRKEKRAVSKRWIIVAVLGILMVVISVASQMYNSYYILPATVCLCLGGVFLIQSYGISLILEGVKKSGKFYYKNIVWLNNFYYRYSSYRSMVFIQFCMGFFVLFYTSIVFMDGIPKENEGDFPYDIVCVLETNSSMGYLKDFQKEYGVDAVEMPFAWMANETKQNNQQMCISNTTYNQLWRDNIKLKENKYYEVGREKNIFGIYLPEIVVFSDIEYQNIVKKGQEGKSVVAMNLPEEQVKDASKKTQNYGSGMEGVQVLCKQSTLQGGKLQVYLNIWICAFISMLILLYGMFISGMKYYAELQDIKDKYRFLDVIGMPVKEQKKNISKELWLLFIPPIVCSGIFGQLFAIMAGRSVVQGRSMEVINFIPFYGKYVLRAAVPLVVYCILQILYILFIRSCIYRSMWKERVVGIKGEKINENN